MQHDSKNVTAPCDEDCPLTEDQARGARHTVALWYDRNRTDLTPADVMDMLMMLGVHPSQEGETVSVATPHLGRIIPRNG